jgi:four helix bundle protein
MAEGEWHVEGGGSMKYQRFEDLPVWQASIDLGVAVFRMTETGCLHGYAGVRDQIERAAVSVSNNIAEGFDRGTHEELLTFLYIALGSTAEVRSMLCLFERLWDDSDRRPGIGRLRELTLDISRQLGAWVEALKNGESRGPRYQNQAARRLSQEVQRQQRFLEKLRWIQTGNGLPEAEAPANDSVD